MCIIARAVQNARVMLLAVLFTERTRRVPIVKGKKGKE